MLFELSQPTISRNEQCKEYKNVRGNISFSDVEMPMLHVRCKTCGREFASGMSFDEQSFKTAIISGNFHTCPIGHTHQYDKGDYFFLSAKERKSKPVGSEEKPICDHDFKDITEERRGKNSPCLYLKCKKCGLLRIKDRPKE